MSFFSKLLGHYNICYKPNDNLEKAKNQPFVFDKTEYLKSLPEDYHLFMENFVQVQMFEEFVREREKTEGEISI